MVKFVRMNEAVSEPNSKNCVVLGYPLLDKNIDLAVATISGRYPGKGYCVNLVSRELIYVLEGSGCICFEHRNVDFSEGDSILIDCGEKYYWDTEYCKATITCVPSWSREQYKFVE